MPSVEGFFTYHQTLQDACQGRFHPGCIVINDLIIVVERKEGHLSGVVATLESTEGTVDCIEPVVERGTFDEISCLEEQDGLRVRETERVLQVEIALSVEVESGLVRLVYATIDRDEDRFRADLGRREVPADHGQ